MTHDFLSGASKRGNFNPHEREARDAGCYPSGRNCSILIHTSVKLVTSVSTCFDTQSMYFNPHEREARDRPLSQRSRRDPHFNPHEREARDRGYRHTSPRQSYFNPHEREARDVLSQRFDGVKGKF